MLVLALKFSRGERNVVCKAHSRRHSQRTILIVLQILATTQLLMIVRLRDCSLKTKEKTSQTKGTNFGR